MKLNFYLEVAAFILGIVLWIAGSAKYNIIDLKDKIYIHMVRMITVLLGLNCISYFIVRNNITALSGIAEFVICLSFLMMVLVWFSFNTYLLEVIYKKNYISTKTYLYVGFPVFLEFILILANWGTHKLFDVTKVDYCIQVVFNGWYKIPYILAGVSAFIYLVILLKNQKQLRSMKQHIFFVIPIILLVAYCLQYRYKAIAILGFAYILILIMLFISTYNYLGKIDNLTKLPNEETFEKMLDYRVGFNQNLKVLLIALNDFKRVNYEYGYANGNRFIEMIAAFLEDIAPKNCIARYGGDKFAVIFENATEEEMKDWSDQVLERFEHSWQVGNLSHKLSVCITMVDYPSLADNSGEILELLENLNSYAKKQKKNQFIACDENFREHLKRGRRISSILEEASFEDKIELKYQPILNVEKDAYTRAEVIALLKDEELGEVSWKEFSSIAEENGVISDIGYLVIKKVCVYIKSFMDEGKKAPIISMKFTRQQFMTEGGVDKVLAILNEYSLKPNAIAIELSGEAFSAQYEDVKLRMTDMYEKGFRFYLGDFGKGLLNITRLLSLPFEIVKINRDMIDEATKNESVYLLFSALIAVFEENGKRTLGDGIESENLKGVTDLLFMNYLQGDYYCTVMTAEDAKNEFQ